MPPGHGVEGHLVVSVNGDGEEWIFIPHDSPDSQNIVRNTLVALAICGLYVQVQAADVAPWHMHPWVSAPIRTAVEAYFTNADELREVRSPFVVRFGLYRWGMAPAEHKVPNTGHHHLLIDKRLPVSIDKPIPFDAHHVHFGKGQMEAVLNLPPGEHTVRMLLADHGHVPHFIYSNEQTVLVLPGRSSLPEQYGKTPEVLILAPKPGVVPTPFRVNFHAVGATVGNAMVKTPGLGHFELTIQPAKGEPVVLDFTNGATEAWLTPPPGDYTLSLRLLNNANGTPIAIQIAP